MALDARVQYEHGATREWLAVQEVSSIPFADLILDASNNNDNTNVSNANVTKKQKKEQQHKQQRQYQPSWEIPKDLSDAMKAKGRSDQSQLKIADDHGAHERKSARVNSRTTGDGENHHDYFPFIGDFSSATDKSQSRRKPRR